MLGDRLCSHDIICVVLSEDRTSRHLQAQRLRELVESCVSKDELASYQRAHVTKSEFDSVLSPVIDRIRSSTFQLPGLVTTPTSVDPRTPGLSSTTHEYKTSFSVQAEIKELQDHV